jgi:DNA-binding NarL/FixJ family response regulator
VSEGFATLGDTRLHIVHASRMVSESIALGLRTARAGVSIDDWTDSWPAYRERTSDRERTGGNAADVVLLDAELRDGTPTAAKVMRLVRDSVAVVVIGAATEAGPVRRALDAGAASYVHSTDTSSTVAGAIEAASSGSSFVSPTVEALLGAPATAVPRLSLRELDVVGLYLSGPGMPLIQVAETLEISLETVRTHLARIRAKYLDLGVPPLSRSHLAARLVADGWIHV